MATICCLLLIAISGAVRLDAPYYRAAPEILHSASDPKDIREIFLTLPQPNQVDDLFADSINDSAGRRRLLDKADFSKGKSILDIPNGYLKIEINKAGEGSTADRRGFVVLTSFTMSNRDRLVVLQFTNLTDFPDPVVDDHLYLLSGGVYKEEVPSTFLPAITFFGDFWGEQSQPDARVKDYVKSSGDTSFYDIEWPRYGTVAKAVSRIPYSDTDTPEMNRIQRVLGKRQYQTMELAWDKARGIFVKGPKTRAR